MMKMKAPMILMAASGLAACAPLSQAGLVYASRGQAGLTLATGTPETPGLEVNIGMKISDFAYIPVVVGRPCEFTNRTDCEQDLILVQGNNDVSESDDDRPGANRTLPTLPNSGDKSVQAPPPPEPSAVQGDMEQRVTENATQAVLAKMTQSNNRLDALSVYGTFGSEGSTTGGTQPGAGLSLNRVFSTGVASQHLAEGEGRARRAEGEGARDARRIEAVTQCMVRAVASTTAPGAGRDQLLAACAVAAGAPAN
jgi:hypothetical protein